jgi:hypothetical protein
MGKRKGKKALSRRARQEIRLASEAQSQHQARLRERLLAEQAATEAKAAQAMQKSKEEVVLNRDQLHGAAGAMNEKHFEKLMKLVTAVHEVRKGLMVSPFLVGLVNLTQVTHCGDPQDWCPAGRGLSTGFRSLAIHLLGGYPAHRFFIDTLLFDGFRRREGKRAALLVRAVISGQGVKGLVGSEILPVPLTRRMCHLLTNPDGQRSLVANLRHAQVLVHGGNPALADLLGRVMMDNVSGGQEERFRDHVIQWLCRQSDLRADEVEPLWDYMSHCRVQDPDFRLKGRTPASLRRGMLAWHKERRNLARLADQRDYAASGFRSLLWRKTTEVKGKQVPGDEWKVCEILEPRQLAVEGSNMHHCVATYHDAVRSGLCSIWTLTLNGERRLTVEVRNRQKVVIQARGRCNRLPRPTEVKYLHRWAQRNGLAVRATGC